MQEVILEVVDLAAGYGDSLIVDGVTLAVESESVVVILGPNGAGKSTVLKAIYGIARVRRGSIRLFGRHELRGRPPHVITRMGMNYVPQLANVFPNLTVRENVAVGAWKGGVPRRVEARLRELFPRIGERWHQRAGSLSGGERQMVALARALVSEPSVLLLDEPSAGLAPAVVEETFRLLEEIRTQLQVAILMVEQNAKMALRLADYVYVLEAGQKRFEGRPAELEAEGGIGHLYIGRAAHRARSR